MKVKSEKRVTGSTVKVKNYEGFTLIELLVVIAIIGILIALSVFGLQGARQSSRDARRKADLEQIRSGLEIYKADCNSYPLSTGTGAFSLPGSTTLTGTCPTSNTYISSVPQDSIPGENYSYKSTDGLKYYLCAALEQTPNPLPDTSNCASCTVNGGATACNYVVTNP